MTSDQVSKKRIKKSHKFCPKNENIQKKSDGSWKSPENFV